ncbi:peptide deformylase [Agaricicola taiwanensis]|nr:peptide deformylase [Agaricicola taiwanensis]
MSILPIRIIPDSVLRQKAEPIAAVDDDVRRLMDDMLETMYDAPGIGLAAPQIGVLKRIVVLDVSHREQDDEEGEGDEAAEKPVDRKPMFIANPEIVWASEETRTYDEGCLSIPDYYEEVERPARVRVRYLDRDGKQQEVDADGILAVCLQHEIDHLDGVLFIDHLSKLKRDRVTRKFAKQAKRG